MLNKSRILQFFQEDSDPGELKRIMFTAVMSGLASIALIAIINKTAFAEETRFKYLFMYMIALAGFFYGNRYLLVSITRIVEKQLRNLRIRITDKLRRCELNRLEKMGKGRMHVILSQETTLVSESAANLISGVQQGIMGLFCLCYIAYLSMKAFVIVLVAIFVTVFLFNRIRSILTENFQALSQKESDLVDSLDHIVDGFKEIRLNWNKNEAIFGKFSYHVEETEDLKVSNGETFAITQMSAQLFLYILLATIIFIMPQFVEESDGLVGKMVSSILFLIGPLIVVIGTIPVAIRANTALDNIYGLEESLQVEIKNGHADAGRNVPDFEKLELIGATFSYTDNDDKPTFTVGPINLSAEKGKLMFITGGNGSGKSTLLKLMTGLYIPDSGVIKVNGKTVNRSNASILREQFGVIFTDFHLFDRFYGIEDVDPEKVNAMITKMELQDKVSFEGGRFSTTRLSTGQRKRLALIIALLEERNIYVFDEWAADQDIHFRKIFYNEIIPDLLKEGRTVIGVTHDDRFWPLADRMVKLGLGEVISVEDQKKGSDKETN